MSRQRHASVTGDAQRNGKEGSHSRKETALDEGREEPADRVTKGTRPVGK